LTTKPRSDHPLLGPAFAQTRRLADWEEWQKWFHNPDVPDEILQGLLYCGLKVSPNRSDYPARLRFYLELADGFDSDMTDFITPLDPQPGNVLDRDYRPRIRANLARRALVALVAEVLTLQLHGKEKGLDRRIRERLILSEEVLPAILWFFRPVRQGIPNLRNYHSSLEVSDHVITKLRQFALDLCLLGWSFPGYRTPSESERLTAARPQLIRILAELGQLTVLNDFKNYPLDEPCLAELERIASDLLIDDITGCPLSSHSPRVVAAAQVLCLRRSRERELAELMEAAERADAASPAED